MHHANFKSGRRTLVWILFLVLLTTGCSRARSLSRAATVSGSTTTTTSTVSSSSAVSNPAASITMVSPTLGSVSVNQPVRWQVIPSGFPSSVTDYELRHASLNLDVTFEAGSYGEFTTQYSSAVASRTESIIVDGYNAMGDLVRSVQATSASFAVTQSSSGAPAQFSCEQPIVNQSISIPINESGNPLARSTSANFSVTCNRAAALVSVSSTFGSFGNPVGSNPLVVEGVFSQSGSHQVIFNLRDLTSNQTASVVKTIIVQGNVIPRLTCQLAATPASGKIAVDSSGNPTARSEVITYVVTANRSYQFGRFIGDGGFSAIDAGPTGNLTYQFRGTYGVPGSHVISVEIKDEYDRVGRCQTSTAIAPLAPAPQPLTCAMNVTPSTNIRYNQWGDPYERSGEVLITTATNRASRILNASQDGGFALYLNSVTSPTASLLKGNFAVAGTHNISVTFADSANANLQATCTVRVVVNRIDPRTQVVWRGYSNSERNHLLTLNRSETNQGTFYLEGAAFSTYIDSIPGCDVQLFRCKTSDNRRFVSTTANCEGQFREGTLGFVCSAKAPNTAQLQRIVSVRGKLDHLTTRSQQEVAQAVGSGGYRLEGGQGFAP